MSELTVIQGSTKPFHIKIFNDNDLAEDLSTADKATFRITEYIGSAVDILLRDTGAANLVINKADSRLEVTLNITEAEGLSLGTFLGQAAVRFGSEDSWFYTDPFRVVILEPVAAKI